MTYYREHYKINEPTRKFKVGDVVDIGNLDYCEIREVLDGGRKYNVFIRNEVNENRSKVTKEYEDIWAWHDIFPMFDEKNEQEQFLEKDDVPVSFQVRHVHGLFNMYYSSGIDMNPDYQRDYVWELKDKTKLIDSIFQNVEIGKFAVVELPIRKGMKEQYEMLDGKQRLKCLIDFYECRFKYKGKYFSDLCHRDRTHLEHYLIHLAIVKNTTKEQKLRYFLKLNVAGVPQDEKHLKKVLNMMKKEQKKK